MKLDEIWLQLEQDGSAVGHEGILRRRIFPNAECDLFVGVEHPSAKRMLLVRVNKSAADRLNNLPRAKGCTIGIAHLPEDPPERISVWLSLSEQRFSDIFTTLTTDIAVALQDLHGDATILDALINRIQRWQSFLDRHAPEGLGEDSQRGLFGELWFLLHILLPALGPKAAVEAWTGPKRAVHDFRLPALSVEAKVTVSKQHTKIQIANERQLDTTHVSTLLLFHLSVEQTRGVGMTLPQLVEAVRTVTEGDARARDTFEDLLFQAGYLDIHARHYAQPSYSKRASHIFMIRDGFPRLVEKDLPPGVGDIQYTILLAQCMPFALDDQEVDRFLKRALHE